MCSWCSFLQFQSVRRFVVAGSVGGSPSERWARLAVDVRCVLRRGAWYPVLSVGPEEAVLLVHHRPTILPRLFLEIITSRPAKWTIVPRPEGHPYAVCPNCAERVALRHALAELRCGHCMASFPVEEAEPTPAPRGEAAAPHQAPTRARVSRFDPSMPKKRPRRAQS